MDSNLVVVSKTFGRTSQLLLNEITSHKLAGIFAKPLSERDAPGYKSLIHRPQDLKSIKTALSKGSRAAIAAIEEFEARDVATENGTNVEDNQAMSTPAPKSMAATINAATEGPIGNGFYLVRKSEDLTPPKGIVNSSQLEMELVRMFANAVMFNPLPTSERGFGRLLRLRKRGGELRAHGARSKPAETEDVENDGTEKAARNDSEPATIATTTSESDVSGSNADEGGIIADAREMFKDVEIQVAKWKEVEGDRLGQSHGGSFSIPMVGIGERHASVSASSAAGAGHDEDDGEGRDDTPTASMLGSVRKRRRIGDH